MNSRVEESESSALPLGYTPSATRLIYTFFLEMSIIYLKRTFDFIKVIRQKSKSEEKIAFLMQLKEKNYFYRPLFKHIIFQRGLILQYLRYVGYK